MANALKLALAASLVGYFRGSNDIQNPEQSFNFSKALALSTGVAANQADLAFTDARTIAASGTDTLDLNGTALTDAFGQTVSFVEIVGLIVVADAANTNDVVVGGAGSNPFAAPFGAGTDKVKVRPGGIFMLAAPVNPAYTVTPATGDLLQIANSAGGSSVTYQIILIGRSA